MVSVKWNKARESPLSFLKVVIISGFCTLKILCWRALLPFSKHKLSLRNEIARTWIGHVFTINAALLYSEPAGHQVQRIQHQGSLGFLLPTTSLDDLASKDAVVLFAHGGGYIIGHALQYLEEYVRWIKAAGRQGKKMAFLAVEYRMLSSSSTTRAAI